MKKHVLIVEDNKDSMTALAEIVKECDSASVIFCAENSGEAYKYAMETRIDLFLVDIVLDETVPNDVSGIIFAEQIRQLERYRFVPLIFVTMLEDYKMQAFHQLHCYGYLEKPFRFEKVKELIESAMKYPVKDERKDRYVYYRKEGILYSIDTEQIIYLESKNRSLFVISQYEKVEIPYKTCSSMLHELNGEKFLQCSRNTVVNRKFIEYVDETNRYVHMKNGKTVEIGRIFKKRFLQELVYDN